MKKIMIIIFALVLGVFVKGQHLETCIKTVNGKARITVKATGGNITGQVSNFIFNVAIPVTNKGITLENPKILDASRLPINLETPVANYSDDHYSYFNLCYTSPNKNITFVNEVEYDLLELNWKGPAETFPVTLISLENGNPATTEHPLLWINYLEIGGKQYSVGDHLFYKSATSGLPQQMAADYNSGTASVTIGNISSKPIISEKLSGKLSISGLFPNPAYTLLNVLIEATKGENITLLLMDAGGRILKQQSVNTESGTNTVAVDVSKVAQGSYLVKVICKWGCESAVMKFNKY